MLRQSLIRKLEAKITQREGVSALKRHLESVSFRGGVTFVIVLDQKGLEQIT